MTRGVALEQAMRAGEDGCDDAPESGVVLDLGGLDLVRRTARRPLVVSDSRTVRGRISFRVDHRRCYPGIVAWARRLR